VFLSNIRHAFLAKIHEYFILKINLRILVFNTSKTHNFPSNMAFLGQDDILAIEKKNGTVRIINGIIQHDPLLDVNVATKAERGKLGFAISDKNNAINNTENP